MESDVEYKIFGIQGIASKEISGSIYQFIYHQ